MLNSQGRSTSPGKSADAVHPTFTGNRALMQEEPLIFEIGRTDVTGVDLDEPAPFKPRLGTLERKGEIGLPGLSEPEAMRHYVRLSQKNYGIDTGLFPLGSCTMKHNPRLNETHGAPSGLRRHPPAATALDRAGRARADGGAVPLAPRAHRHGGRGAVSQGRRAWRIMRHDGDQGRHRGEGREAQDRARAGIGAWHQSRRPPRSSASR